MNPGLRNLSEPVDEGCANHDETHSRIKLEKKVENQDIQKLGQCVNFPASACLVCLLVHVSGSYRLSTIFLQILPLSVKFIVEFAV